MPTAFGTVRALHGRPIRHHVLAMRPTSATFGSVRALQADRCRCHVLTRHDPSPGGLAGAWPQRSRDQEACAAAPCACPGVPLPRATACAQMSTEVLTRSGTMRCEIP